MAQNLGPIPIEVVPAGWLGVGYPGARIPILSRHCCTEVAPGGGFSRFCKTRNTPGKFQVITSRNELPPGHGGGSGKFASLSAAVSRSPSSRASRSKNPGLTYIGPLGAAFRQSTKIAYWLSVMVLGVLIVLNSFSAALARLSSPAIIASSPIRSTAYPPAATIARIKASSLWSVSPFERIAMSATPASPTRAIANTTKPPQLSVPGEKYDNNQPIGETYLALREFLSGLMLIAVGFLAALIISKRK